MAYQVSIQALAPLDKLLREQLAIVRWQGSDYVDAGQLDRLLAATPGEVEALLAPQGYFSPHLAVDDQLQDGQRHLQLTITPGERTRVSDVNIRLHGAIQTMPDYQRRLAGLLESWPLAIGAYFSQTEWDSAKRRGLQSLIIEGFPAARLSASQARIVPELASAELSASYDSGPRFTLGKLEIKGLQRYPRSLVDGLLTFAPGDDYSQQRLLEFQTALQNTPYFSSVLLDVATDPAQAEQVPVKVELVEAPPHKTDAGLGYGTDKGARLSLGYRDANLLGRGWIGALDLNAQQREQTLDLKLQLPPDSGRYTHGFSYRAQHEDIAGQQLWQQTLAATRTRLRGEIEVSQSLQYTRTWQRTEQGSTKLNTALVPSQSWTRRDLDNRNDPRSGTVINMQLGGAAQGLLSTTSFLRTYAHLVWYVPINRDSLLLMHGEAGQVLTRDPADVPSDWLFRAGGTGSVRGYGYQTLGVDSNGAVVGGRVLATGGIEYQRRVWRNWRAALFADIGGAADRWQDYHAVKGFGVGARWASPVGPFAFDLAYGADAHNLRFHFSLGAGF
ncbi:autotransporter assembly complex family protein [Chitinimonas sp.]|uniref:autotransporter assembly complex protein TamA n=1 Tax=Chitinimonas sp. TaxID=1934313 RepID=UPI0035B21F6D